MPKTDKKRLTKRLPKSPSFKRRPSDPTQAKEWLGHVAEHLSKVHYAGPAYRFVAAAIKRYLRGSRGLNVERARNLLYSELALVERPGRRHTFQERMAERERGRKAVTLKESKKPWHMIAEEIGMKDKRSVQRIYKKTTREKQQAEMDRDMKEFLKEAAKLRHF